MEYEDTLCFIWKLSPFNIRCCYYKTRFSFFFCFTCKQIDTNIIFRGASSNDKYTNKLYCIYSGIFCCCNLCTPNSTEGWLKRYRKNSVTGAAVTNRLVSPSLSVFQRRVQLNYSDGC